MSLSPLLNASPIIQIHVAAALTALVLGGFVLFRHKKGDAPHRMMGKVWVALMAVVAVSSLFIWTIRTVGPFSPIHILSLGTLFGLWQGVRFARQRNIKRHMRMMQVLYFGALVIAGLFTFLPGRLMNRVVFGPNGADPVQSMEFFVFVGLVLALAALLYRRSAHPARRRHAAA